MTTHTWISVTDPGTVYDQFGRALWNALAPLHGEPLCYARGETPWATIDLADSDVVARELPYANLNPTPVASYTVRLPP
jgi:hypothetical protein